MRWADLPLCPCSLRHWPEEIADRHLVSEVSGTLDTPPLWVSGDAPEDPAAARWFTEQVIGLGVRRIVDVRAEMHSGSSFDHDLLSAHGVGVVRLGVVDHNDAFADTAAARTWTQELWRVPTEPTLVHCHMGVNRSASAAVLMLMARGFTVEDATGTVLDNRRSALAVYAPASLRALGRHEEADSCRNLIVTKRSSDRRLRDVDLR